MEPGSDEAYRDKLPEHMVYQFNNAYHGRTAKRMRRRAADLHAGQTARAQGDRGGELRRRDDDL